MLTGAGVCADGGVAGPPARHARTGTTLLPPQVVAGAGRSRLVRVALLGHCK